MELVPVHLSDEMPVYPDDQGLFASNTTAFPYSRCYPSVSVWHFSGKNSMYLTHDCPYSPTILKNILSPVPQIFLYSEAFKCKTTSDWLYHMV